MEKRTCRQCGKEIDSKQKGNCCKGTECSKLLEYAKAKDKRAEARKQKEASRPIIPCPVCGKMFKALAGQVNCSTACTIIACNKAQRERKKVDNSKPKKLQVRKKKVLSILQVCVLAKQKGISYGQYVGSVLPNG